MGPECFLKRKFYRSEPGSDLNLRFKVRLGAKPDPRFRFGFRQKVPEPEPNWTVDSLVK